MKTRNEVIEKHLLTEEVILEVIHVIIHSKSDGKDYSEF